MINITDFQPAYADAFKELNYEWIRKYFKIEESDRNSLEDPQEYILDKGGIIIIALLDNEPVGTCALIKMEDNKYELAKMAVAPRAQGKKIGWMLGEAIIKRARELGANTLYLETNSTLQPAIKLYKKLGFQEACGYRSPYERCNVQMELTL